MGLLDRFNEGSEAWIFRPVSDIQPSQRKFDEAVIKTDVVGFDSTKTTMFVRTTHGRILAVKPGVMVGAYSYHTSRKEAAEAWNKMVLEGQTSAERLCAVTKSLWERIKTDD